MTLCFHTQSQHVILCVYALATVIFCASAFGQTAGERKVVAVNGVEYAFRFCPAGLFMMGSPKNEKNRDSDEMQHEVMLTKGFWMLETEVTQEMWESVMGRNPSDFKGKKLPVEQVSWEDCQVFIQRLNQHSVRGLKFALPTESQWEYACRAGMTEAYGGTGVLDEMGWQSGSKTHAVGQKQPNTWGLYDMHGNVFEWCSDRYGDYSIGNVTDPVGPPHGSIRVLRGGSWNYDGRRSAYRAGMIRSAGTTILASAFHW